ncbi:tyrosinase cofactor [Streptomyces sp. NPDC006984]|uniref:apotyrosinase chaperone MelC1 n=1 Tax=unclassified Streptomyces TaxID=2593676 RepID=UPI0033C0CBF9
MSRITRRQALGAAVGAAVGTAGVALVGAAPAADRRPAATGHPAQDHRGPQAFDEVYLGRRIQGAPASGGHTGHGGHHGAGWTVRVDGEELHVMRNADGTWISVITHYEPVASPHAAARAAVRELQGAHLVPFDHV